MTRPNFINASRHASELARWAMLYEGLKSNVVSRELVSDLERCAEALGFKVVKADEAPVVMSR